MKKTEAFRAVFENSQIHDQWIASYRGNRLQDAFNDSLLDRIIRRVRPSQESRVLDAGCGTGEHTLRWARRGFSVVGVDISNRVLDIAKANATKFGLDQSVTFLCSGLEELTIFDDGEFDVIHCRGVLMHVPQWLKALDELCRVLKPGGKLIIIENNRFGVEMYLVRLLRLVRRGDSRMIKTEGGIEFHPTIENQPLVRVADQGFLERQLAQHGVHVKSRLASEFWDIGRWREGFLRNFAIRFNQAWFNLHGPARLSLGNVTFCEKT